MKKLRIAELEELVGENPKTVFAAEMRPFLRLARARNLHREQLFLLTSRGPNAWLGSRYANSRGTRRGKAASR